MSVEEMVRDFWATRPRRRSDDRKVGGVAAAIGRRYAIDPVLVRVAFVIATLFAGTGVLFYLLGWLLLPADGDEVSAAEGLLGRGHSSVSPALTLVLGIALIPAAGMVVSRDAFGVIQIAVVVGALFLLHHSRAASGEIPMVGGTSTDPAGTADHDTPDHDTPDHDTADLGAAGTTTADPATAGSATSGPGSAGADSPAPQGPGHDRAHPPAWDPLSAAPFAWDLPEPTPIPPEPPPQPRGPRSKVTPVTLGIALLVGGIASAFWPALSLAHIVALVLGVVGLGLVVGSLVQGGRGLIMIAVPLALLTWVLHAVPVSSFKAGDQVWNPTSTTQVQPHYELTAGDSLLDLSRLPVAPGQTVTTSVSIGVGRVEVVLPPTVDAQVICRTPIGSVDCLGRISSALPAEVVVHDNGVDGPGGGTLILEVRAGVGDLNVVRGS